MPGSFVLGLKYICATLAWLIVLGVCGALVLFSFAGHALSLVTALPLIGYESVAIDDAPMLGPLLGDLFPEATFADWMALVYAGAMGLVAIFVGRLLGAIRSAWRDRAAYLASGDAASARFKLQDLYSDLSTLLVLLVPAFFLVRFDLALMELRNDAVLHGIAEPGSALLDLPTWANTVPAGGAALSLVHGDGLWGYLAMLVVVGLCIEIVLDRLLNAVQSLSGLFAPATSAAVPTSAIPATAPTFRGYDANGQPIPLEDTTTQVAYDTNGQPVVAPAPPPAGTSGPSGVPAPAEEDSVPVVGGAANERVRLTDALAAPDRYYVDPATRQVWSRARWRELHEVPGTNA